MKLTKKELERVHTILGLYWGIPDTASKTEILDKLESMITQPKPPKYFPIETAPINKDIHVWNIDIEVWKDCFFTAHSELKSTIAEGIYTHWRPMPKGPK